jgi:putative ABC transport system substrate-binding protein
MPVGPTNRRTFIAALGGAAAWPLCARGQQPPSKIYRIGVLSPSGPYTDNTPFGTPLLHGLAQQGYVQGASVEFDQRAADGYLDRLPHLVDELAASNVDVLITGGYPPALAAKRNGTIPAVAFGAGDPVQTGLVESLARPGGNLTGISDVSAELTPKRMDLLKQLVPTLKRVAMLWNAADLGMTARYTASEAGAKSMGISVQALGVREPEDFSQAFAAMERDLPDAILMVSDSLTMLNRKRIFEFAAEHRLPAIYEFDFVVREGGLMSYAPDLNETCARVASLVDRVLKGAIPADLPFEEPTRFKFAFNLKTAKALGLTVAPTFLALADEVIE